MIMLPLALLTLAGCEKNGGGNRDITWEYERTETFEVASEKGIRLEMIGAPYPCTMLRSDDSEKWFAQPVGEFDDYEEGYEYVIRADRFRVIVPKGMEVDGPLHFYTLKEVVSKTQRDTDDISWSLPIFDSWREEQEHIQWPAMLEEQLTVLRTADEFEELTGKKADTGLAVILDRYYSILLVSGRSNSGIQKIEKHLTYKGGGDYLFEIDITQNDATVVEPWIVAVLVPKIPAGADVKLLID